MSNLGVTWTPPSDQLQPIAMACYFRRDFRTTENPPPRSPGTETPAGDFDMGALDYNGGMFPHIKTKPRAALAAQW